MIMQIEPANSVIFLYGPPGSGKSTIGQTLAEVLSIPFWDLEEEIENHAGMPMAEIFAIEGEEGYHSRERRMLELLIGKVNGVVALGGSSLLDPQNRQRVTSAGPVLCLTAPVEKLIERLHTQVNKRPTLEEDNGVTSRQEVLIRNLTELVQRRFAHYASFPQIDVSGMTPEEAAWAIQISLGRFHVNGIAGGYDVMVGEGILEDIGAQLQQGGSRGMSLWSVMTRLASCTARALSCPLKKLVMWYNQYFYQLENKTRRWRPFLICGKPFCRLG